jgi:signal transduction histidine kinase
VTPAHRPRAASARAPSFETPLWRALAVFRVLALAYAVLLYVRVDSGYDHPGWGWVVLAAMAAWTAFTVTAYERPHWRRMPLMSLDLAVAAASILVTRLVDSPVRIEDGEQTLPVVWPAAAALVWAVRGPWWGAGAATLLAAAGFAERGGFARETVHNIVLLVLAATIIGYAVALVRASQQRLARALQVEAATQERERLARDIHDSVLQVLALVARRGAEAGGEAAALGRLAGEQEVALRSLVTSRRVTASAGGGSVDLRELLSPYASGSVTVSAPATEVAMDATAARELAAAVGAALHNVERHAGPGARAWVLVEDEGDAVVVSVRDDGVGFDAATVPSGRMGIEQSIRGRVRDLGGTASVVSAPGRGCEVEMRVPRRVPA